MISYLLWNRFEDHPEVAAIQIHKAYKPVSAFSRDTTLHFQGEPIYTCYYKDEKTPKNSIPFDRKVDCGVRIGFIDERYADDIKETYRLRNLAHIETEAKRQIEVELEHAKRGYWRMQPFLEKIKEMLAENG